MGLRTPQRIQLHLIGHLRSGLQRENERRVTGRSGCHDSPPAILATCVSPVLSKKELKVSFSMTEKAWSGGEEDE